MRIKKRDILLLCCFLLYILGLSVFFLLLPKSSFSQEEKRELQAPPAFSWRSFLDGSFTGEMEAYLADHFPARKQFVGLHDYFDLALGHNGENGIYMGRDGWLINAPITVNEPNFQQNLKEIRDFAGQVKLKTSLMVVPSTGYVVSSELPALHAGYPDGQLLARAKAAMGGDVQWVDVAGCFEARTDKTALYYRTDHHWTSFGAYLAYGVFAASQGFAPRSQSAFQVTEAPGFYGTTYSKSGFWGTAPDVLALWQDRSLKVQVTIQDDGKPGAVQADSMFFTGQLQNDDHYPVFFDGNHSLVRIVNPAASGGRLLIVKDSYANCLAPFLAEQYKEIVMIDPRYFRQASVSALAAQEHMDEVLFVYGMDDLVNDRNLSLMS